MVKQDRRGYKVLADESFIGILTFRRDDLPNSTVRQTSSGESAGIRRYGGSPFFIGRVGE